VPSTAYNDLRFCLIGELGRICQLDIHPLIMNTAGELALDQVFRKGVSIFQRDAEAIRSFRRRKLPLIAEFSYDAVKTQTASWRLGSWLIAQLSRLKLRKWKSV
jgi:hypothetical protein